MKRVLCVMMVAALLVIGLAACGGSKGGDKESGDNLASMGEDNTDSPEKAVEQDPYAWFIPDSAGLFGMVPVNAFYASWALWEHQEDNKDVCERHRELFKKEAESLKGKVIPTEVTSESNAKVIEPFTIVGYDLNRDNLSILPTINIKAKIDIDPSLNRKGLTLVGYENDKPIKILSLYGINWGYGSNNTVIAPITFIGEYAGVFSRMTKIVVEKTGREISSMNRTMELRCANAIQQLHKERKGKYSFTTQANSPSSNTISALGTSSDDKNPIIGSWWYEDEYGVELTLKKSSQKGNSIYNKKVACHGGLAVSQYYEYFLTLNVQLKQRISDSEAEYFVWGEDSRKKSKSVEGTIRLKRSNGKLRIAGTEANGAKWPFDGFILNENK